ncbi:Zinc finger protein 79 [Myotis davidii]|uniref:Zinc finger protein 79 n=1 Tax=Myotis davidii TaxID=225400 RepID=L5LKM3_MYODS|nr:Zinc finger protein 79 [Myotis davidii]
MALQNNIGGQESGSLPLPPLAAEPGSSSDDWKTVSESPPEQDFSEESFQNTRAEIPPGESDHRSCGQGKSFNL